MEKNVVKLNENELIVKSDGSQHLSEKIEEYLDFVKQVEEEDKNFRKTLESLMIENGLYSEKVGKYNVSICFPKSSEVLNVDKILENASDEEILPFVVVNEEYNFNLEGLKEKYPEIYELFNVKTETVTIDEEKLKRMKPELFDKYKVVVPSIKKPYITIKESKR